jgi:alkanesulfonate monooxygenase SsuD/methylene tetrahydromethanopterin reductase-like flavin-dependent oxidoreductase (luciferase family)
VTQLRWGLSLSLAGELAEPRVVADIAARAEAAGWDGVFVWEHLWNLSYAPFADAWGTLAAVALATERVRIGTLVTPLPRRRPQIVAQQATTLDRLSNGRLILGLGLGVDSYGEFSAFGEPADDDHRRAAALDRGIELLLPALAGAPVPQVEDRWTTVAGAQQPRLPIWIAGRPGKLAGPRRALRHQLEGVALVGVDTWSPDHVTDTITAAGLDPQRIDIVLVGGDHPDPDALAAAGAAWAVREFMPGASADDVRAIADTNPHATDG